MDVQQNARPAMADEPMVPNTPARGRERRSPILNDYVTINRGRGQQGKRMGWSGGRWALGWADGSGAQLR